MGLDTVELVMEVEDHFGVLLREDESQRIRTIGDLADVILSRVIAVSNTTCPSFSAFYELRSTIRQSLEKPDLRIRPSTELTSLIPLTARQKCWTAIKAQQPWRFPALEMPRGKRSAMLACIFLAYLIPWLSLPMQMWILSIAMSSAIAIATCVTFNRYRTEIPHGFTTVGDLVRNSVGAIIATRKTNLTTKSLVLEELLPIVSEQFGVDVAKLNVKTSFRRRPWGG